MKERPVTVHRLVLIIVDHEGIDDEFIINDLEEMAEGFVIEHDKREIAWTREHPISQIGYNRNVAAIELFKK
jgi:hypothetical protein